MIKTVSKPADADAVLAIDVSNLGWRSAYAHENLATSDGRKSGHIFGSVRSLVSVLQNDLWSGKWCIAFCYDGANAGAVRRTIVPSYKSKRDPNRWNPVPEVSEVFRFIPGLHIEKEGREGDDALAWVAKKCSPTKPVVLLTGDKDIWALMDSNVKILSPNLKRFVTQEDVVEHYGITQCKNIPLCKSLFGDPSDDIKGVERLQKKMVRPVIEELSSNDAPLVSMGRFLAALAMEKPVEMSVKAYDKIIAERQRLEANYSIILPNLDGFGKESVVCAPGNSVGLVDVLRRYECFSLLELVPFFFSESSS
jgi:DNA polymerase-1